MARNEGALRMGVEAPQTHLQRFGEQSVVGIQENQVAASAPA
jgi:hypothetical protein